MITFKLAPTYLLRESKAYYESDRVCPSPPAWTTAVHRAEKYPVVGDHLQISNITYEVHTTAWVQEEAAGTETGGSVVFTYVYTLVLVRLPGQRTVEEAQALAREVAEASDRLKDIHTSGVAGV